MFSNPEYKRQPFQNIVGKGENACINSHFVPFSIFFKSEFLMPLRWNAYENMVGKAENASNHHFLLFSQCFPPYQRQIPSFELKYPEMGCLFSHRLIQS